MLDYLNARKLTSLPQYLQGHYDYLLVMRETLRGIQTETKSAIWAVSRCLDTSCSNWYQDKAQFEYVPLRPVTRNVNLFVVKSLRGYQFFLIL